jgi:Molybdenum cofactor biosynthesis enzyme
MAIADLPLADTLARPLRDLRISVTDRCQFRCTYCMPREVFGRDFVFLPRGQLLTFEELTRLARVFAGLGVRKLRLTGGEPLLRRDLEKLVAMLAGIGGIGDIALTTNGALLAGKAQALAAAGPAPGDRQPGLPRRRGVHGAQRRRVPGRAGAGAPSPRPPAPGWRR